MVQKKASMQSIGTNSYRMITLMALVAGATLLMTELAHGFDGQGDAFQRKHENGVTVWRAKAAPTPKKFPALLGNEPVFIEEEIIIEKEVIVVPRYRPAKVRVIGHYSGYGKRIPYVQGFYSGYPRSQSSRNYVQGFYSGYKTNKKRRFPSERPDGRRRYNR